MKGHFKTLSLTLFLSVLTVNEVTCNFKILLLHTNDMHSHYKEVNRHAVRCQQPSHKCFGGFARVRAAVRTFSEEARKKGIPTLYLDAGDVFQETVFYSEFKWKLAVKMMNLLRPRAMSLGNHEFDDGIDGLVPYVKGVDVPIVCCNIDTSQEPRLQFPRSIVITLGEAPNTAKIGIVGYLTRDISKKKLGNVKILDEIESLKAETKILREEKKVDIIIALGHSGYEMDQKIAKAVGDVDVIVGGHSHTFLYKRWPPSDNKVRGPYPTFVTPETNNEKRIPIVQASFGTKYLGHLELEWDDNWKLKNAYGLPVLLSGEIEQDREVLEALKEESDFIAKKYQVKIGYTEFTLKGRSAYCRFQECNIGNLITDAFVDYISTNYRTENGKPVLIGLVHSGAIKGSLFAKTEKGYTGEITLEDLITVLPFGCSLEVLEMKGNILKTVLERSMDKYDIKKGTGGLFKASLMQVSGLRLKYDLTKEVGHRLVSVTVAPEYNELDDNSVYNVVMPDYLAQGNDYSELADQKRVVSVNKEEKDYMVVEKFTRKIKIFKKRGRYSKPEGRISIHLYSRVEIFLSKLRNVIALINPVNGLHG